MRTTPLTNWARRAYRRYLRGPRRHYRLTRLDRAIEAAHFAGLYCLGETFSPNGEILSHG